MVRLVLFVVLFVLIARTFWRIVDNVIAAASGQPPRRGAANVPVAKLTRDPVCGTFVSPERSLSLPDGRNRVYFCSETCRDKFRSPTGSGSNPADGSGSTRAKSRGEDPTGRAKSA
jgi:YHS domain-containing protein